MIRKNTGTKQCPVWRYQDYAHLSYVARCELVKEIASFLASRGGVLAEVVQDEKYRCLSAIARRRELHPEMPNSAQQLLMHLQEAEGVSASPFGKPLRQEAVFGAKPWYSIRMFACLELQQFPGLPLPHRNDDLVDVVLAQRRSKAQQLACADSEARCIAGADIQTVLQQFYDDPYGDI